MVPVIVQPHLCLSDILPFSSAFLFLHAIRLQKKYTIAHRSWTGGTFFSVPFLLSKNNNSLQLTCTRGLLTYAITSLVLGGEEARPPALDRSDAVVEVIMRALTP